MKPTRYGWFVICMILASFIATGIVALMTKQTTLKSGTTQTLGRFAFDPPFAGRPFFQEVTK